jgi:hypothetical protein
MIKTSGQLAAVAVLPALTRAMAEDVEKMENIDSKIYSLRCTSGRPVYHYLPIFTELFTIVYQYVDHHRVDLNIGVMASSLTVEKLPKSAAWWSDTSHSTHFGRRVSMYVV